MKLGRDPEEIRKIKDWDERPRRNPACGLYLVLFEWSRPNLFLFECQICVRLSSTFVREKKKRLKAICAGFYFTCLKIFRAKNACHKNT